MVRWDEMEKKTRNGQKMRSFHDWSWYMGYRWIFVKRDDGDLADDEVIGAFSYRRPIEQRDQSRTMDASVGRWDRGR